MPYAVSPLSEKPAGTPIRSPAIEKQEDDWGQIKRDVTFTVTARKTLVFTTEYIYSMGTPYKYIRVLELEVLQAPAPEP